MPEDTSLAARPCFSVSRLKRKSNALGYRLYVYGRSFETRAVGPGMRDPHLERLHRLAKFSVGKVTCVETIKAERRIKSYIQLQARRPYDPLPNYNTGT